MDVQGNVTMAAVASLGLILIDEHQKMAKKKKRKKRKIWVHEWRTEETRFQFGLYSQLVLYLEHYDRNKFKNLLRMSPETFHAMEEKLRPHIEKQRTFFRNPLEAGLKLAVTLRHMASGNDYASLEYTFRVPANTISVFVPEVCRAIVNCYCKDVLQLPSTPEEWKKIAKDFETKWNLPHCLGAIDGKHVAIKNPPNAGSLYYNYKHFFSIVLMAVVDANYKFLYINVGATGAGSDGGVFKETQFCKLLEEDKLGLPPPEEFTGASDKMPFYFVGDEAFPLRSWLMKPVPRKNLTTEERIYNYRISRARRVVENAFGLLSNRFRCLLTTMGQRPETVTTIVMACCIVHNILREEVIASGINEGCLLDQEAHDTHEVIPGTWRSTGEMPDLGPAPVRRGNFDTKNAKRVRDYLIEYVNGPAGSVPWQEDMI
jgi:hypothetical protein